jgi:hypothetical protein
MGFRNTITKRPQSIRTKAPFTAVGTVDKAKELTPLPTKLKPLAKAPPPMRTKALQKLGAALARRFLNS